MVTTDPISDMLTRIRNAIAVHKTAVSLPHSNAKEAVANILKEHKYISGVKVTDEGGVNKTLVLSLNNENENSRITEIKRLSKPGRRMYSSSDKIPMVKQGRGIVIVSTSKGLLTGLQARQQHIGGELICEVY
jgi:small subunit ribosomal protein S8